MKSILRQSEASNAGINMSPTPMIETFPAVFKSEPVKSKLKRLAGKMNFIGFSTLVATVTMTSDAKTKTQSYSIITAYRPRTKCVLPI